MTGQRLAITPGLLRQAWAAAKRGPGWPATFDEAARHPLYSRLLRATACGLAQQQQHAAAGRRPALPPHPIDLKRRAAGDTDADD